MELFLVLKSSARREQETVTALMVKLSKLWRSLIFAVIIQKLLGELIKGAPRFKYDCDSNTNWKYKISVALQSFSIVLPSNF